MMKIDYRTVLGIIARSRGAIADVVVHNYLGQGFMGSVVQQIDVAIVPKPHYQTIEVTKLNAILDSVAAGMTGSGVNIMEFSGGGDDHMDMVFGQIRVKEVVGIRVTVDTLCINSSLCEPEIIPDKFDNAWLTQSGKTHLTRDINLFFLPSLEVAQHVKRETGGYSNCGKLEMDKIRQIMSASVVRHQTSELATVAA